MRRLNTIIKQVVQIERELNNYPDEEIKQAIEKFEKDNGLAQSTLLDVIYEGATLFDEESTISFKPYNKLIE